MRNFIVLCAVLFYSNMQAEIKYKNPVYQIWDSLPAPNSAMDSVRIKGRNASDKFWESESYPIGNGYMGANIFGRTDTERIQITEKTLCNDGSYHVGGLTNFAEILLDFNQQNPQNYSRTLSLNDAILNVKYEADGVKYYREYFMSYPDNVMVVRISANKKNKISFTIRPQIPYKRAATNVNARTGIVYAQNDLITLSGTINKFSENYEAQIKVINDGGTLTSNNKNDNAEIKVSNANAVTLILATGTNYVLSEKLFLEENSNLKLNPQDFPHQKVSNLIGSASSKGFDVLKKNHVEDYQSLFSRVKLNFNSQVPKITTRSLLNNYKAGNANAYLEELIYHYGRYLLISSSRIGTQPCGLQGVWTQYELTPWSGGYWHNINIQMNYWGAFNSNLAETFTAYIDYYNAYLPKAKKIATSYLKNTNPELKDTLDNGWIIGTGANPFTIGAPGGHSGPGTGGFTTKLFWDYYDFTRDTVFLRKTGYPCLLGMSKFLSKTLVPDSSGFLLVKPSASPEQRNNGKYYITTGTTFDQSFVWENHTDLLKAAKVIGAKDSFLSIVKDQVEKLDPIIIGQSGQVKEYREEKKYSDIGEPFHRHVSHLCGLYPGTLINSTTPDWMAGVVNTLDFRGNKTTGWALAHRMNLRARTKDAEKTYEVYSTFIKTRVFPNLWCFHPPFQIDGNLGCMAGVAEMLIQSHEGYIEILPALPIEWKNGEFKGLVARGNFEVSTNWNNQKAATIEVISKMGGECSIKYPDIDKCQLKNAKGKMLNYTTKGKGIISFETNKDDKYFIELKD